MTRKPSDGWSDYPDHFSSADDAAFVIEGERPVFRFNGQPVDRNAISCCLGPRGRQINPAIVNAITRNIDNPPLTFKLIAVNQCRRVIDAGGN